LIIDFCRAFAAFIVAVIDAVQLYDAYDAFIDATRCRQTLNTRDARRDIDMMLPDDDVTARTRVSVVAMLMLRYDNE